MALTPGIPTCKNSHGNWTHTDNVFTSAHTKDLVTECNTIPHLRPVVTDHVPIRMRIDFTLEEMIQLPCKNFHTTDWKKLREVLERELNKHLPTGQINNAKTLQIRQDKLTRALQAAIEEAVPTSRPGPNTHRWWNPDLSKM
ncbi:hypothetical protein DL96DRAFT_1459048 [Flagelloscypha sp. PMI_526]|nr:hypothetical protein DL96DRAFT_1459048 [Flagelloscypha sp. PMI_526]